MPSEAGARQYLGRRPDDRLRGTEAACGEIPGHDPAADCVAAHVGDALGLPAGALGGEIAEDVGSPIRERAAGFEGPVSSTFPIISPSDCESSRTKARRSSHS